MKPGWEVKRLGEMVAFKPPKSEARRRLSPAAQVSFVPMTNLQIDEPDLALGENRPLSEVAGSYTYFADGDVLLAKITPCYENGKQGVARGLTNGVGFGSSEFHVLRPRAGLLSEYLYHFLNREELRRAGARAMTGAVGHKRVPEEFLASQLVPVPPIAEQQRTVEVLDEAFAALATATVNAERILADARELFDVYLNFKIGQPRPDWAHDTLGQALRFVDYRGKTPVKVERGIRLITAKNVKMGYIQTHPEEFVHPDSYDKWMVRGFPKRGDVLFTTEAPLGNVAQLDTDERVVIGQRLITFQPVDNRIAPTFLKYALLSKAMQNLVRQKATGATVQGIKASLLKLIPICYPHDAAEQARIASRLDEMAGEVSKVSEVTRRKLTLLAELKQSLLQRAFAGELA